jgi:hypothetical protein
MEAYMNCKKCEGAGKYEYPGMAMQICNSCCGGGTFPEVDKLEIRNLIMASRGKNKGKLKSSMTSPYRGTILENRSYYVWRMARFHGGVDVTMPVIAGLYSRNDPYLDHLDLFADEIAKESFGNNVKGALRWARALGY